MTDSFQNRLVFAMNSKGVKAAELSKQTGLSKAQISQYVNGIYEAKQIALYKLAVALDVSEAWLMGQDVPMERGTSTVAPNDLTLLDTIRLRYGSETSEIVTLVSKLNDQGKKRAVQSVSDLAEIEKYRK